MEKFKLKQWGLPRTISDHCPVLLKEDDRNWGPKPFKFFNAWLSNPKCLQLMEKAWVESNESGWAGFKIHKKLKSMKDTLKVWAKEEFGELQTKLEKVELELHELDIRAENGNLEGDGKEMRKKLRAEMWKLTRTIDRMWWQKSRVKWHLFGDKNTRFYHIMASSRQRRNSLNSLWVNDTLVEDPILIRQAVFMHLKGLYEEDRVFRPFTIDRFGDTISEVMANQLVAEFTEEEVWNNIKSCDGNKAPGPDGFNMLSIKKGWRFMKKDIMVFLGEFHRNNKLTKSLNSTFITLIPKVDNPMGLTDFRPISLIGIMYKILSKVLASRIKMTIPVVVGEVQSAFSGGKNIQDGILIANEVVEEWKRCRKRGLIIKLDFEKAFDKLNWNYLLKIMERMGFPSKWREWIQECLSSARVSVLIN